MERRGQELLRTRILLQGRAEIRGQTEKDEDQWSPKAWPNRQRIVPVILNTTIHQVRPDSEHPAETQGRDAASSRASNAYLFCRRVGRGSRDQWNQEGIQRDTWGDALQKLAHAVMETEKSHHLLSASQGTPKARG